MLLLLSAGVLITSSGDDKILFPSYGYDIPPIFLLLGSSNPLPSFPSDPETILSFSFFL